METLRGSLRDLLTDVVQARGDLTRQRRRQPVARFDLGAAQHRLVMALHAYEAALGAQGAPLPYQLRAEIRLLEGLDVSGSDARVG